MNVPQRGGEWGEGETTDDISDQPAADYSVELSAFVMNILTTAFRKSENSCFLNYVKTSSSLKKSFTINVSCLFVVRKQTGISFSLMAGKIPA